MMSNEDSGTEAKQQIFQTALLLSIKYLLDRKSVV